ncbi:MAG: globin domain-containing protein [bacterium]
MSGSASETAGVAGDPDGSGWRRAQDNVLGVLERLATREREALLVERFYERFFDSNPEVVPLFGPHSISEREEMIAETLRSLLALCENETGVRDSLRALGASHAEYGVTTSMYPAFTVAFTETLRELLGCDLSLEAETQVGWMLDEIGRIMAEAGEGIG